MNWKVAENRRKMGDWLITEYSAVRKSDIIYIYYNPGYIRAMSPTTENGSGIETILADGVDSEDAIGYLEKYLEELGNHSKWILFRDWKILLDKYSLECIYIKEDGLQYKLLASFYSLKYYYTIDSGSRNELDQLKNKIKEIGKIFQQQADRNQWLISDLGILRKSDVFELTLSNFGMGYSIYCYFKNFISIYLYRGLSRVEAVALLQKHAQELSQIGMTKSAGKRKR